MVAALTDSAQLGKYWTAMKARVQGESEFQLSTICRQLKLPAEDGKMRETDCADIEGMFRIIQSIPSPKAEPFKRWLARVGFERVREAEISKATFGVTPSQYKKLKGLKRENLRDHMDDFELIFTMLGERSTLEKEIHRPVVNKNNYLPKIRPAKRLKSAKGRGARYAPAQ